MFDVEDPKNIKYFGNLPNYSSSTSSEIIVEKNEKNEFIFMDRNNKILEIYDIRKEN